MTRWSQVFADFTERFERNRVKCELDNLATGNNGNWQHGNRLPLQPHPHKNWLAQSPR